MRVMIISSFAPTLLIFREDMMRAIINKGHEVFSVAPEPEEEWSSKFEELGIKYFSVKGIERTGTNPMKDIIGFISLYKIINAIKPDKIFTYQAKTIIYGCLAARLAGVKEIYVLFGGLGSVFRNQNNSILRRILIIQYKVALKCCKKAFFQNNDDYQVMLDYGLTNKNQMVMINGSGVNMEKFVKKPLPRDPVFLFIGRIIKDKGVMEYVEAAKLVKNKYPEARMQIIGYFDTNPTAIKKEEIQEYLDSGIIEYLGFVDDVRPFLEKCLVFVLPSYHEGTPKSVLEAMATGRPIITTNAPGCRETVVDGINGFLVPVKNTQILAEKMIWMIEHRNDIIRMAEESYNLCKKKFDAKNVNDIILKTMSL